MKDFNSAGWRDDACKEASIYGVRVSLDAPITGVVANNDIVQFLGDTIGYGEHVDLGWEEALEEFEAEYGRLPDDEESEDLADAYYGCGLTGGPHLIGDWRRDDDGLWEPDPDREDGNGFAAIVREDVTQVLWSRTTTRAHHCSPCYPGQADIGTDGVFLAYSLPSDLFDPTEESDG